MACKQPNKYIQIASCIPSATHCLLLVILGAAQLNKILQLDLLGAPQYNKILQLVLLSTDCTSQYNHTCVS